jgi:tetratricopeptide (TPR) repeat protein
MEPTEEIIQELIRLRKQARFLDAWALLKDFAPPEAWTHPKHRASAARLIENLGDDRRATAIRFKLWRRSSTRFAVREDMVWHVLQTRGPYLTWEWLLKHPPQPDESEDVPRDHPGIQAYLLGRLRDFERAESFLQSLFETTTEPAWAHSIHADLLASQDRHEEALEAEERALAIRPALVSAVLAQDLP